MGLKSELENEVSKIFSDLWDQRDGDKVPSPQRLILGNEAVNLRGTVLYADLDGSTKLVDAYPAWFAAEIYKAYLHCAARIVRSQEGVITAYDGDRIMAVFIHATKNTSAAKTALKINYAVKNIINPAIAARYPRVTYRIKHVVGVDTSKLFAARIGVRGDNDLVWVGRAANYAAKLSSISEGFSTWITGDVFNAMLDEARVSRDGRTMWTGKVWKPMRNMQVYGSNWTWEV